MNEKENDLVKIGNSESSSDKPTNKNNTFNIIIGISTLLIAILGATFAYFSATATSAENDVNVKSAYVSISYDGGTEIKASNLIPATETVALTKYQKEQTAIGTVEDNLEIIEDDDYSNDIDRRCVDAKGREVCYVYQFTIESDGENGGTTDITGGVKINTNEFTNLSYVLYEVTFKQENGIDLVDKFGHRVVEQYMPISSFRNTDTNPDNVDYTNIKFAIFEKTKDNFDTDGNYLSTTYPLACLFGYSDIYDTDADVIDSVSRCSSLSVANKVSHTYQLVIWLEETGNVQYEQGLTFEGTVSIEVPGGLNNSDYENGQITGKQ